MSESGGAQARFEFRSPDLSVELEGPERFVTEQVALVAEDIRRILADGHVPAPDALPSSAAEAGETEQQRSARAPLEEFYLNAKTREGRGSLQDSILIFAWYLQEHQHEPEFLIEDIQFCFDLLNIRRPKSLANTLGILKRDRGWFQSGTRRGSYVLTTKGKQQVKELV